jgi:hypothetical protein
MTVMRTDKSRKLDLASVFVAGAALFLLFVYFKAIGGVVIGYSGLD